MSEMSPKERIRRFFEKKPIDTMPCFSGMGMVTVQAIDRLGIRFPSIHTTAENMAASALASAEIYGFDAAIVPYDMCTVPEALGRGISLYEDSEDILYPTVPTKWATMEEVEIPRDFLSRGRMPVVDEAFGIIRNRTQGKLALGGWVLGPFTMAGQLVELDILLKGTAKKKAVVEGFMNEMTELVIQVGRHYQELGADYINIREMGTGSDLLSPRLWKTLIQPYLRKIFAALDSPKILHICGSTDMIIEMMNECGADALSVDQKNDVSESRRKLGNEVLLLGNFDPYGTLVQMDVDRVRPVIEGCIDSGVDAVWPGCDLWPAVKRENVEAYVGAVREYGRKPSPAVGRN